MYKNLIIFILLLFVIQPTNAQFYKSVLPSPEFNNALEKIVGDFRYNFENIIGEPLVSQGEVETYGSTIKLPGATDCIIYKFHSALDTTASWQGVLYQGDDYREAVKAYKNTFRLLNKSRIHLIDRSIIGFAGQMSEPSEDVRFTVSTLQLNIADPRYEKFNAEVEMTTSYTGWQVNVNFFNKKPDSATQ